MRRRATARHLVQRDSLQMDVLQIDHTPVDVIVVDAERRLPIGRPWLTLRDPLPTIQVQGEPFRSS